jgi:hypothetical protein
MGVRMVIHGEEPHGKFDGISRVHRLEESEVGEIGITFNGRVNLTEDARFARLPAVQRYVRSHGGG